MNYALDSDQHSFPCTMFWIKFKMRLPCYPCVEPQAEHFFEDAQQAIAATSDFRQHLYAIAQDKKFGLKVIADQSYPTEVIALRPKQPQASPLLLLGGMGPLAGLISFEQACLMFKNNREIVLFQACFLPDRTAAIQQRTHISGEFSLEHQLVVMLEASILQANQYVCSSHKLVQTIVLCNTAHYFFPKVLEQIQQNYPKIANKLQWVSLIESVIQYLKNSNLCKPLILGTTGTRLSRIYSQPLHSAGIAYSELNESLQATLMSSLYQGVKAFDFNFAGKVGEKFFVELLNTQPNNDCIIAGCTEIPCLLEWLKATNIEIVKQFLSQVEIIDPLKLAFKRLAC
jgi:aspartate racemase